MQLRIAAKVDAADQDYFRAEIEPLFRDPLVEYIGEIGEKDKGEFLGNAHALLFPIDWPEPFGLVMIEAMACGTPVVAWPCGSVPEVIDDGVTGYRGRRSTRRSQQWHGAADSIVGDAVRCSRRSSARREWRTTTWPFIVDCWDTQYVRPSRAVRVRSVAS